MPPLHKLGSKKVQSDKIHQSREIIQYLAKKVSKLGMLRKKTTSQRETLYRYRTAQGWIQLLSKVGVHIRHTITRGVGGHAPPGKKLSFGKNIVHFL